MDTSTPVTLERFLEWKAKRQELLDEEQETRNKQRKADIASGKVKMSGRELFFAYPGLFVDDEMAASSEEIVLQVDEIDPLVPVNIVSATGTSLTRISLNAQPAYEDIDEEDKE